MQLNFLDWSIVVASLVFSLLVGLYFTQRASRSLREFFTAEGSLPWWLVGTSMVATTFAADTPLVVSGLVRKGGIYENWLWWSALMGGMMTVYFLRDCGAGRGCSRTWSSWSCGTKGRRRRRCARSSPCTLGCS